MYHMVTKARYTVILVIICVKSIDILVSELILQYIEKIAYVKVFYLKDKLIKKFKARLWLQIQSK